MASVRTFLWQQGAEILLSELEAVQWCGMLAFLSVISSLSLIYKLTSFLGCTMYTAANAEGEIFIPVLATFLGDTPEALRAACMMLGNACLLSQACWTCRVSGAELNLLQQFQKRNYIELLQKVRKWNDACTQGVGVAQAKEEAKSESMYIMEVIESSFVTMLSLIVDFSPL